MGLTYAVEQQHCQVVTTVGSEEAAQQLAHSVVLARLAACAQVLGPLTSTYWWEGALTTEQEWQVLMKTTTSRYPQVEAHIRDNHEYDVPEILCLPVVAGNPPYLAWIAEETAAGQA
jgi:periplasmic divalent cation tolerance protein